MNGYITHETDITPLRYQDKCDKWDYLIAVCTGAIGGIIDIFFVGSPMENSQLLQWTDNQTDSFVKFFAKANGWSPRAGNEDNIKSAIGFLEKKFPVNYDQATSTAVDGLFKMGTKNHHMKSLAHSPSILGLFFSVVNQFTGTSTFLNNGQLITIQADGELLGGNFTSKLFAACVNWIGHLVSDVAGSSGSVKRGSGIVAPLYELFGLCNFGKFKIIEANGKPNLVPLSQLATRAFQEGYDFRYAATTAIPVIISDLLTRFVWAFRKFFQMEKPLNECIPTSRHDDLRVMLLISNGVLCVIDGIDAGIRFASSGGNWLTFFMRLNLVAWCRFFVLVLKEICIRVGMPTMEQQLEAFRRTREAVSQYLEELRQLDIALFEAETKAWNVLLQNIDTIQDEDALSKALEEICEKLDVALPYKGDFDDFMSDPNSRLVFE